MKYIAYIASFCLYVKGAFAIPQYIYGHQPYPEQVPLILLMALCGLGLIGSLAYLVKIYRTPTRRLRASVPEGPSEVDRICMEILNKRR